MKCLIFLLSIFLMTPDSASAQVDPFFTTDGFGPFWNNPASTGANNEFSANSIYRNGWPSISASYQTFGFNLEANASFGSKTSDMKFNMPIGLNVIVDQIGFQNVQTVHIPISIPVKLKNSTLAFGTSAGIKRVEFDNDFIIFGDSLEDLEGGAGLNFNTGIFWSGENYYLGASITNLNRPELGIVRFARNYNFQAGYRFKVGQHHIFPMLNGIAANGFNFIRTMTYFQFKEDVFSLGAGFSSGSSYSLGGTFSFKMFKVAYLYDFTVSSLSNTIGGAHEFRLSYAIAK